MDDKLLLYGRNPVEEALESHPERIDKIYVRDTAGGGTGKIISLASQNRIPVQRVPGRKLNEMVGAVNDQGVVAIMSAVQYHELEEWLQDVELSSNPTILLLDELEDVANFGAILRTAAAAGIQAVIVPKHRQAPVNSAVLKTSAGTAGKVPIIRVVNINQSIKLLKDVGFWVVGMDQHADRSIWEQDMVMPTAIVVGNEGKGIREHTLKLCDIKVSLPMANGVESLNASVSAALLCYEIVRQKRGHR